MVRLPTEIKRNSVRILGQPFSQKETLQYDLRIQSRADVRRFGLSLIANDVVQQGKAGNHPSRVLVDNLDGVDLRRFKRKIEVLFGDLLSKELIKAIERGLRTEIIASRDAIDALSRTGWGDTGFLSVDALASRGAWEWLHVRRAGASRVVQPLANPVALSAGDMIVYRPRVKFAGLANMFAARQDAGISPSLWPKPLGKTGGAGFMARAIAPLKRAMIFKNYVVYATFTKKFNTSGDTYNKGGMPCIVVRARRKGKLKNIQRRMRKYI